MVLSKSIPTLHSSLSDMNLPVGITCNRAKDPLPIRVIDDLVRTTGTLLYEKLNGPQQRQVRNFINNHPNSNFNKEEFVRRHFCGGPGNKYFDLWNKCRLMLNRLNAENDTFAIVMVVLAVNTHVNVKSTKIQELVVDAMEANKVVTDAENDVAKAYLAKEKAKKALDAEQEPVPDSEPEPDSDSSLLFLKAEVSLNEKRAALKEAENVLRKTVSLLKTVA